MIVYELCLVYKDKYPYVQYEPWGIFSTSELALKEVNKLILGESLEYSKEGQIGYSIAPVKLDTVSRIPISSIYYCDLAGNQVHNYSGLYR